MGLCRPDATVLLAALIGCNGAISGDRGAKTDASTLLDDSGSRTDALNTPDTTGRSTPDASFVCTPPDGATQAPVTFSGMLFDVTNGCLSGPAVTLPICGCFNQVGLDSSTWCFSAPDGTTYFAGSSDECSVEMPQGWYAVQTFGPSPFGTPTSAQETACGQLAASSTSLTTGTYDRPGPPLCPSDGGTAPVSDAASCVYPLGARTYSDASGGCRPEPGGTRCQAYGSEHFLLGCSSGPAEAGAPPPTPGTSLGCSAVPVEVPNEQYYCCPCGS